MKIQSEPEGIQELLRGYKWSSNLTEAHVSASCPVEDVRYRLRLLQAAAKVGNRLAVEEVRRRAEMFNRARNPRIKLEIIETGASWIRSQRDLDWWEIWAVRADRADARADRMRVKEQADHHEDTRRAVKKPLPAPRVRAGAADSSA